MKKPIFIFLCIILTACSEIVDKPKNLIEEPEMSKLIAELIISEQLYALTSTENIQAETKFIFNKHKINPKDFSESYKYYIATGTIDRILENTRKIIKENNPESAKYIDKKLRERELPDQEKDKKKPIKNMRSFWNNPESLKPS
ncbi:MAG: DUF4296 domain-containing protein [Flavobacteriaceae bacterium]|jgi:hypothetical protein|nr:DUF4296 domain-containing protein [Flavobacteriaceae bacterium]